MNKVVLTGRITRDPEIRYTQNGLSNLRFSVAVDRAVARDASGNRQADFINCVAFGQQADFISRYVKKGNMLAIEGRIQTGSYEKDGQRVYTTDVVADNVQFLESKAQSQNRVDNDVTPSDFAFNNNSTQTTDMSEEVFADFGDSVEISDDDIAF